MEIRSYREGDLAALHEITLEAFDGVSIDQIIERRFGLLGESDWKARKASHIDADVRRDVDGIFVAVHGLAGAAGFEPATLGFGVVQPQFWTVVSRPREYPSVLCHRG